MDKKALNWDGLKSGHATTTRTSATTSAYSRSPRQRDPEIRTPLAYLQKQATTAKSRAPTRESTVQKKMRAEVGKREKAVFNTLSPSVKDQLNRNMNQLRAKQVSVMQQKAPAHAGRSFQPDDRVVFIPSGLESTNPHINYLYGASRVLQSTRFATRTITVSAEEVETLRRRVHRQRFLCDQILTEGKQKKVRLALLREELKLAEEHAAGEFCRAPISVQFWQA